VLANTRCTLREEKGTPVAGALLVLR